MFYFVSKLREKAERATVRSRNSTVEWWTLPSWNLVSEKKREKEEKKRQQNDITERNFYLKTFFYFYSVFSNVSLKTNCVEVKESLVRSAHGEVRNSVST